MSIQTEITRISGNVSDALDAIAAKGVTIPSGSNSDDMATLIGQISTGGNIETNKAATLAGGTTVVTPSAGYDGMAKVTATVPEIQMSPSVPATILNTTWYLNDELSNLSVLSEWWDVQFTFPNCVDEYYYFELLDSSVLFYYYDGMGLGPDPEEISVYDEVDGWEDDRYRRITITGGTDVSNSTFIAWLRSNAQLIGTSQDFANDFNSGAGVVEVRTVNSGYLDSSTGDGVVIALPIQAHDAPTRSGPTSSSGVVAISHTQAAGFTLGGTSSTSFTLTTKSAQTYTPTTTDQTITAGRWLTGTQTIKGDANLVAGNIKKDVPIFGVTGTYEVSFSTIRTGSGAPSSSLGVDGDIYIQTS